MNDCDAAVVRTILFLCSYMNNGNATEEVCFHSYVAAQQMQKCIAEGFCKRMTTTTTAMIHCYHTNEAMGHAQYIGIISMPAKGLPLRVLYGIP